MDGNAMPTIDTSSASRKTTPQSTRSAAQSAGLHRVSMSGGDVRGEVLEEGIWPRYMQMQSMQ
jgi:hypothetical protein